MPTAAELALQKKYAEMRAKKQQQADNGASLPPTKPSPATVTVKPKPSPALQSSQQQALKVKQASSTSKQAPAAAKPGPKITLKTNTKKPPVPAGQQKPSVCVKLSSGTKHPSTPSPLTDPQSAALEAAKKVLAARQAAIDKAKAAQGTAQKRPTFRRPTTKPPAPAAAPAEEEEAEQPSKKPRLDSLFQQSAAQPQNPHEHVANDGTDAPQAWSPTQHTNLPYSPGAEGTAWSPTAGYQAPQPSQQGYSPSHQTGSALEGGYGQPSEQAYSYTGAGHPGGQQADQADRTVFVGNLPDEVSEMELAEYFCELGEVLAAQIRGNDGGHYGFVEFALPEHVQHVLSCAEQQPFMIGDNYLRVQLRRPKGPRQGSASAMPGQEELSDGDRQELPGVRAARIKAEMAAAAAAAVDELDPDELRNIAPAPPPDRQLMVYDDI